MNITIDVIFSILNILLSVTAVCIAIISSRNTSKDATRQIESIIQLSKIQIETSIKQIEVEIQKNAILAKQAKEQYDSVRDFNNSPFPYNGELMSRRSEEQKAGQELQFYCSQIKNLESARTSLNEIKERLNGK